MQSQSQDQSPIRIRVAGLLKRDQKILLVEHTKANQSYYLLPGGGADGGSESLAEALKREFLEEMNMQITVGNLALVSQNFASDGSRNILHLIFFVFSDQEPLINEKEARLSGFRWFSVSNDSYLIDFRPNILPQIVEFAKNDQYNGMQVLYPEWV